MTSVFSTLYIISKVKKCCMFYQSTVHPGGWFSLAEMAACLCSLFSSILDSFPFTASSPLVISFSLLPGALLIFSALPSTFSPTDKQRSVSLHSQVYVARLQIVELSCQEDFFLALCEFDFFPYGRKTMSKSLSSFHPFFLTACPSLPARFGWFCPDKIQWLSIDATLTTVLM